MMREAMEDYRRPILMEVPEGATAEQMELISHAIKSDKVRNGARLIVEEAVLGTPFAEEYRNRMLEEILPGEFKLNIGLSVHVLESCEQHFRRRLGEERVTATRDGRRS